MAQSIDRIVLRGSSSLGRIDSLTGYTIYDIVTKCSRSFEQSYASVEISEIGTGYGGAYVLTIGYTHRTTQKIELAGIFDHKEHSKALETALEKARILATERAKSIGVPLEDEIYIREQHLSRTFKNSRQDPTRPREGALSGADDVGRA